MPSRKIASPSQANPAWTTLPEGVFDAILDKLCQDSALAAARSTCKAWKASVSLHQKSLAATLSEETLQPCAAAFPRLQGLRIKLSSSSAVLSTLSTLSQLQSLTLDLEGFATCLDAREISLMPRSIRRLFLFRATISTEGLTQLPSLGELRELDIRGCQEALHWPLLLDVLPELKSLEVFGVNMDSKCSIRQEVKPRVFWDTICRLSRLAALQLDDYCVYHDDDIGGLDYPAGLKHLELLRGDIRNRMLSGIQQLETLVIVDQGWGELSREGLGGLTSLTSLSLYRTKSPLWTVEALSLKELRLADDVTYDVDLHTIASMQQLTYLELEEDMSWWAYVQPLPSLNLKQLVLKNPYTSRVYVELFVPGSLQGLDVLDLRKRFEVSVDSLHEVAVAIMLLPKLKLLAGDCVIIRQVVDQSPKSWAVCTADDIVSKYGTQTAYIRIR